jgi:hypothetical protein
MFLGLGLVLLMMTMLANTAWAVGIVAVHGSSGHIEYQDRIDSSRQHFGWGLDFVQSPGVINWIHYSIPMALLTSTRYIGLKFETGSVDCWVSDIHVYDGRTRIFDTPDLGLSGDTYKDTWYVLDMGSPQLISDALGISIEVSAGVEMMSHRVRIFNVGAVWQ